MLKHVLQRALLLLLCTLFFITSWSQGRTVTGTVLDDKGTPLTGATVTAKNTKVSTSTNLQGIFTLSVPANTRTLVVSFVGMQSGEVSVGNGNAVTVTLSGSANALNDVVVIGYGKAKRANLSSAQSSVSAKEIDRTVNTTVEQAIQGRAAGVYVTQNTGAPGGGMSIAIRGVSSINGRTDPLYVIDGVQFQTDGVSYGDQSSSNPLSGLNPSDIDNIQILQGPAATAVYGARAATGVVLITTKRGQAGDAKVNYNFQHVEQTPPPHIQMMDLQQYAQMTKEFHAIAGGNTPEEFLDPSILGKGTDWQKALFKNAPLDKHQLSISGGSDKNTYYMSGEYLNQQGIAVGSGFKRYSFRLNVDSKPRQWATIGVNLSVNQTKEDLTTGNEEIISRALALTPQIPVKNLDGSWGDGGTGNEILNANARYAPVNPIAIASLTTNKNTRREVYGGINLGVDLFKGLTFRSSLNTNIRYYNSTYYLPKYQIGYAQNATALLKEGTGYSTQYILNELLEYNRQFGKHNLNVIASHEAQSNVYKSLGGSKTGFLSNNILDLQAGDDNTAGATGGSGSESFESYLGRISYNYDNRYIYVAAWRGDGSAKFGPNNKWGYFPSMSAAWRVSQEHFFHVPFISELKFRAETGKTGNTYWINPYYSSLNASASNGGVGFLPGRIPNPDAKWEETQTNNVGLNIGLFKDRIKVEADYYVRKTKNLLMEAIEPSYLGVNGNGGAASPIVNDGDLKNKGWSLTINTTNIVTKDFRWESNINVSSFKTTISYFNGGRSALDRTSWWLDNWTQRSTVGGAPWLFRGYIEEGLFQSVGEINKSPVPVDGNGNRYPADPDGQKGIWVGDVKYRDISGPNGVPDGKITQDDITNIGNPWPKLFGGFTNSISYKGFDLSILVTGTYGNDVYNFFAYRINNPSFAMYNGRNLPVASFNYAKPILNDDGTASLANPGTNISRLISGGVNGNNSRFTNKFVENGSYLRLKNISLSYNVSQRILNKTKVVKGIRATIGVQNIATLTHYSGYDPEVGSYVDKNSSISNQAVGLDNGRYPLTPIYTFNLGVNF